MKKIVTSVLLIAVLAGCQFNETNKTPESKEKATEIREKLLNRDASGVMVVAHRGDWRNYPENSLMAIDNAIEMGVEIVEIDVRRTMDSVLILMHDVTLDRTTTGKGRVSETPFEAIQKLKLRNGINIRTIHEVPTLEEALLHAKGRVMLNLDKADSYFDQIYDLAEKTGTTHQIIMKGGRSVEDVKEKYGPYLDKVIYMPVVNLDKEGAKERIAQFIEELDPVAFELVYADNSNELPLEIKEMLEGRSLIWYNTLWDTLSGGFDDDLALTDPDLGYGYLIDTLGARMLQTDRPQYLLDYLRERKLHD